MSFDRLSGTPNWDDDDFRDEDKEGEEWKPNVTRDACKAMYLQWQQVMILLTAALETMNTDTGADSFTAEMWETQKDMLMGDAYEIAVKIKSSESGNMYLIRMENASIIRKNAQFIKSSMLTFIAENAIEEDHGILIRKEIDLFRKLFINWVATFKKDEFEDEWGLFI